MIRNIALIVFLLISPALFSETLYWVSFGSDHPDGDAYIMQINELGQITKAPKVVIAGQSGGSAVLTAIAQGPSNQLVLFTLPFAGFPTHEVFRTLVSKSTLNGSATQSTGIETPFTASGESYIQVGMLPTFKFLVVEGDEGTPFAYRLTDSGIPTGIDWILSPRTDPLDEEAGVSADGRMAFVSNTTTPNAFPNVRKEYLQPLKSNGHAGNLDPNVAATSAFPIIGDASNPVAGGAFRFFAYADSATDELFVQKVDSSTGEKQGNRKLISDFHSGNLAQGVAVDPKGRFVLFISADGGCPTTTLFYQALSANGAALGNPKSLVNCNLSSNGLIGLDIVAE